MPPVTRSMTRLASQNLEKMIQKQTKLTVIPHNKMAEIESVFIILTRNYVNNIIYAYDKSTKLSGAIYLFRFINQEFPSILVKNPSKWLGFCRVIMNKTIEFENQEKAGLWNTIDKNRVNELRTEYLKTRLFITPFIA